MLNILFDFDGTLFDTDKAHERAFRYMFKTYNLGEFGSYEQIKGIRTKDVFSKYVERQRAVKLAGKKTRYYLENVEKINALVRFELLCEAKRAGNRLFIVSGGSKKSIYSLLELHQLVALFDGVVTSNDYKRSKPDPEPFLHCLEKYSIKGDTVGVEDSAAGIESLKKANIFAVGTHNELIRDSADRFYSDINDFLEKYILNEHG